MNNKHIGFAVAIFLIAIISTGPSFSQLPTPTASCVGDYDLNGHYHPKGEHYTIVKGGTTYDCVACGGCTPINSKSGGTSTSYGGAPSSEQFAQQMMVNILGSLIQQALAPPPDNSAYLAQQAALEKAKKEAEKKAKLAKWQQLEQAKADRQQKEKDNLRSMLDVAAPGTERADAAGTFDVIDWGGTTDEFQARSTGRYDTSGLTLMQRLACANDFAERARDASQKGDYVNARYLNEQAENVMVGRNTELECQCDDVAEASPVTDLATTEMTSYEDVIKKVQQDIKDLQTIKNRLKEIDAQKQVARQQIEKAREDIATVQNKPPVTKPATDNTSQDSLLELEAQQLLAQAQDDLAALEADEQDLTGQQTEIENSLKAVQQQYQTADTGQ